MRRAISSSLCAALLAALAAPLHARTERTVSYAFDDVFPAAVRFLRIDEDCRIVEKDAEAGYLLFELTDEGKQFRGALEVVRTRDSRNRPAVRLLLRLENRPDYMEGGILDRFQQKLRADLGEPPPPPSAPAPEKPAPAPGDAPAK